MRVHACVARGRRRGCCRCAPAAHPGRGAGGQRRVQAAAARLEWVDHTLLPPLRLRLLRQLRHLQRILGRDVQAAPNVHLEALQGGGRQQQHGCEARDCSSSGVQAAEVGLRGGRNGAATCRRRRLALPPGPSTHTNACAAAGAVRTAWRAKLCPLGTGMQRGLSDTAMAAAPTLVAFWRDARGSGSAWPAGCCSQGSGTTGAAAGSACSSKRGRRRKAVCEGCRGTDMGWTGPSTPCLALTRGAAHSRGGIRLQAFTSVALAGIAALRATDVAMMPRGGRDGRDRALQRSKSSASVLVGQSPLDSARAAGPRVSVCSEVCALILEGSA